MENYTSQRKHSFEIFFNRLDQMEDRIPGLEDKVNRKIRI
jgi:hypothetical protein